MRRRTTLCRLALAGALVVGLASVPAASAQSDDPLSVDNPGGADPYPALDPAHPCTFSFGSAASLPQDFSAPDGLPANAPSCVVNRSSPGGTPIRPSTTQVTGTQVLGLQGAPHLSQWLKIPVVTSMAVVGLHVFSYAPRVSTPAGTVNGIPQPPPGDPKEASSAINLYPRVWFLSADRKRVGEVPAFRARTVAFGSIPVQVTVHISQPIGDSGAVEPIELEQKTVSSSAYNPPGYQGFANGAAEIDRDAFGTGSVDVRLSDVTIDDMPVDVGQGCRTKTSGALSLFGKGYYRGGGFTQPPGTYNGQGGGLLTGTVDIPAFLDCTSSSGDDISAILTNAISGSGNPISVFQSPTSATCFPQSKSPTCGSGTKPLEIPGARPDKRDTPVPYGG